MKSEGQQALCELHVNNTTHLELVGAVVDVGHPQVDRLGVVGLNRLLEQLLQCRLVSIRVLQVEQRNPNVELLLLLAEVNGAQCPPSRLARLVELREADVEGDELDPEVRRVGGAEKEAFKVGNGFRCLRVEVASLVVEGREVGLALLAGLLDGGDGLLLVVGVRVGLLGGRDLLLILLAAPVEATRDGERGSLDGLGESGELAGGSDGGLWSE